MSDAEKRHYRIRPVLVAGTTVLIRFSKEPYSYAVGKICSHFREEGRVVPPPFSIMGIDNHEDVPAEISIDITIQQTKGYVLNGD